MRSLLWALVIMCVIRIGQPTRPDRCKRYISGTSNFEARMAGISPELLVTGQWPSLRAA
jgi:hypothetical protein